MGILKKALRFAKKNPQIVIGVATALAPGIVGKLASKAGPIIAAAKKD